MRPLNERELNTVSGGTLLLGAALAGANLLGGLLNDVTHQGNGAAAAGSPATTAVKAGGTHGFAPATRQPGDFFDGMIQRGAGVVEAAVQDVAGHLSAGVRDVADLVGRLV